MFRLITNLLGNGVVFFTTSLATLAVLAMAYSSQNASDTTHGELKGMWIAALVSLGFASASAVFRIKWFELALATLLVVIWAVVHHHAHGFPGLHIYATLAAMFVVNFLVAVFAVITNWSDPGTLDENAKWTALTIEISVLVPMLFVGAVWSYAVAVVTAVGLFAWWKDVEKDVRCEESFAHAVVRPLV